MPSLSRKGVRFLDIAGNDEIFLTAIAPKSWKNELQDGRLLFSMKILTRPGLIRLAIIAPVKSLHRLLPILEKANVQIEHLYDY